MAASLAQPFALTWRTSGVITAGETLVEPAARDAQRFSHPDLRIRTAGPTRWLAPVVSDLARLLSLPEGWDSYGGEAVRQEAAAGVIKLLARLGGDVVAPFVAPTSSGGIHLEWNTPAGALEIEVEPADRVSLLAVDAQSGAEIEEESVSLLHFFAAVFPKVSYLIPRA